MAIVSGNKTGSISIWLATFVFYFGGNLTEISFVCACVYIGFSAEDIVACGVTSESEDYRLIQRALSHHNSNGSEIRQQLVANEIKRWSFHDGDTGNLEIRIAVMTLKLRALKQRHDKYSSKDKFADERFTQIYHKRKRLMKYLRERDFGRYKKIMTYLGLRDKFNPSILSPGVHPWAHVYSKKKPPGGRRGHVY